MDDQPILRVSSIHAHIQGAIGIVPIKMSYHILEMEHILRPSSCSLPDGSGVY
jgi:hypothetical protein